MRRSDPRIAVLGAGIMGCSLALMLARRGARVTLVDQAPDLFAGASRWNEGKIHIGFLYAGDSTLATARKLIPGGLAFRPIVEELVGRSIADAISKSDDLYLTHRDSIVDVEAMAAYLARVVEELRAHPESRKYFSDVALADMRRLSAGELSQITTAPEVLAGFQVPERSVHTAQLADWFIDAVSAEPAIEVRLGCRVAGVVAERHGWRVEAMPSIEGQHDILINALWEGRAAVDRCAGLANDGEIWSYRYRLSLFAQTAKECSLPSAVIATGPFGDIKNYDGRNLYLSWYPAGLLADLPQPNEGVAPRFDAGAGNAVAQGTITGLTHFFPGLPDVLDSAQVVTGGGWIVARGSGSLADPESGLHRRDRFGVSRRGSYISVDTGKYSTAPWLARRIAEEIVA